MGKVELSQRAGLQSGSPKTSTFKLPTLRFRGKIMLGFAVVLAITAASMGFAYLGFAGVSAGVASYRNSVAEADLARNIDRELISYRGLARYYVATGKEADAKAALAAQTALKNAIDQSLQGTKNPARLEGVRHLAGEFGNFTATFADILKVKAENAQLVQNQLTRGSAALRQKFDDLANTASEELLPDVETAAKQVGAQYQGMVTLANTFVLNSDVALAKTALAGLQFVGSSLQAIPTANEKIAPGVKEATGMLAQYREALSNVLENTQTIGDLETQMNGAASAIMQGASAMKADLVSDQQRLEAESDAAIVQTEHLILMLAAGGFLLGAVLAILLGKGISRPMTAMCKAMRELAGGNFEIVLPGLGRKDGPAAIGCLQHLGRPRFRAARGPRRPAYRRSCEPYYRGSRWPRLPRQ